MGENKETPQELSYDKLHEIAVQATQQLSLLQDENNKLKNESLFIRLEFLFKVLDAESKMLGIFNKDFVNKCALEIEELMTIPSAEKAE